MYFCECMQPAFDAHLKICAAEEELAKKQERVGRRFPSSTEYPRYLLKLIPQLKIQFPAAIRLLTKFAPNLCHRCNAAPLYGTYGYSDRSSNYFVSHFRPYINQGCFVFGLHRSGELADSELCPPSLLPLTNTQRFEHVEELVRSQFGFPQAGINNNQESMVFLILRRLFPGKKILRRQRPAWLGGLELDIVVEDLGLAIEFQGVQHAAPMKHLGGEAAFKALRRRDKRKAGLCREHGLTLVEIHERDGVTEQEVREALSTVQSPPVLPPPMLVERAPFDFTLTSQASISRWTNYYDRDSLSIVAEWTGGSQFMSGTNLEVAATFNEENITEIAVTSRERGSTTTMKLRFSLSDQPVFKSGRETKLVRNVFRVWATLDPNIQIIDAVVAS